MSSADEARAILSDARAPEAERFDAEQALAREHRPRSISDLDPIFEALRSGEVFEDLAKARGMPMGDGPSRAQPRGVQGMRSVRVDEMRALMAGGDYVEKAGSIDFGGLRAMADTPIIASIISTRIRQMARFAGPSEDGGPGYEIRHVDKDHELTDGEKKQMKLLSRFIANCGFEFSPRQRKALRRDSFPTFLAKTLRDSLSMDAAPIETEFKRNKGAGIDGFYAVDGASVRLCSETGHQGDDEVFALQVVSGKVATLYDRSQLIYEVRNPRTNMDLAGYGFGECELLIRTVTSLLTTMSYNSDYFDKNSIPKGVLQLYGDYGKEDLASFRRHWASMVSGTANNWSLPLLVAKDKEAGATYLPFNAGRDEMAFAKWITFLTSVSCAIYNIDPSEIGFESFAANKSTMSGSDTGEKLAASLDKGFRPIASHIEGVISDFIISDFDSDFCFRFAGMEEKDEGRSWEAKKLVATVDEVRAVEGMVPHPDPRVGALPINPVLVQPAMQFANPTPDTGDFGAGEPAPTEPGQDFGPDALPPPEAGTDFGAEPGQPGAIEQEAPQGNDFGGDAPAAARPAAGGGGGDFGKALQTSFWRIRAPWFGRRS
jgi:hypothetical protein